MTGHSAALADDLRHRVRARVIGPDEPDFRSASQGWNLAVPQYPAAVVEVASASDVAATVQFARAQGLAVSAQATGHSSSSTVDGTILIRTTGLRQFTVDSRRALARVAAGAPVGALLRALDGTGLIALAGSSPSPSFVGYLLGGGLSWFGRRYGYAAHHVLTLEVVTADGDHATVTADTDAELYWALRGGGGDFAIVTGIELTLPRQPEIAGGRSMWPLGRAPQVFAAYREITQTAPRELTAWLQLLNVPDLPEVPPPLRGQRFVAVDATYLGPVSVGRNLLAPVLAIDGSIQDSFGPIAIGDLGSICAEPTEPSYGSSHAMGLNRFDEQVGDALLGVAGPESPTPLAGIQIRHLGGALTEPDPGGGVAGTVTMPFLATAVAITPDPDAAAAAMVAFAELDRVLGPATSIGLPFNALGPGDSPSRTFSPADLDRLRRLKRERDPHNIIRSNRPFVSS
jgi:hypothetical protein